MSIDIISILEIVPHITIWLFAQGHRFHTMMRKTLLGFLNNCISVAGMVGVHRDETILTAIGQITLLYDDAHFLKPKLLSLCLHIVEVRFRDFLFFV